MYSRRAGVMQEQEGESLLRLAPCRMQFAAVHAIVTSQARYRVTGFDS